MLTSRFIAPAESPNGGSVAERQSLHRRFEDRISVNPTLTRKAVSYQGNRHVPGFRWMKYKEGFSRGLVEQLIGEVRPQSVLDPFSGIGTTPLIAAGRGLRAAGIEIIPVGVLVGNAIAHAANGLEPDELRRTFEESAGARGLDPIEELGKLLQADGEPDADAFWQSVVTNLSARRLRLLFIADDIPDPLERVVEFLNSQMPNIEVLAVEIKRFQGRSTQTLVPRIIGRTAGSASHGKSDSRRKLTRESFIKAFTSVEARAGVTRLMDVALKSGAQLSWGSRSVTVRINCSAWNPPVTVAWLNVPSISSGWMGFRDVGFGAAIFSYDPPPGQELRDILKRWIDQFRNDDFARFHSGVGAEAWVVTYEDAARNIDVLASRLANVLSELKSL